MIKGRGTVTNFNDGSKSVFNPPNIECTEIEQLKNENMLMKQYIKNGIEFGYIDDRKGDYKKFF